MFFARMFTYFCFLFFLNNLKYKKIKIKKIRKEIGLGLEGVTKSKYKK